MAITRTNPFWQQHGGLMVPHGLVSVPFHMRYEDASSPDTELYALATPPCRAFKLWAITATLNNVHHTGASAFKVYPTLFDMHTGGGTVLNSAGFTMVDSTFTNRIYQQGVCFHSMDNSSYYYEEANVGATLNNALKIDPALAVGAGNLFFDFQEDAPYSSDYNVKSTVGIKIVATDATALYLDICGAAWIIPCEYYG